ncbi:cytochrome c-type biogenesis protein [Xanthomonas maliensis]|uniref:cytochrome c-type biogenesis protein n=1 Tax=Xanthomonas maliensis TaxID=1321368 RepID=UPI00039B6DEE|nr:cytochrome c-type biogenesis protein [Xanthomonas maliensis]KAB7769386.1 cytochrome c-type biogenesis protein CcmH [Xanthomonas maliensis]
MSRWRWCRQLRLLLILLLGLLLSAPVLAQAVDPLPFRDHAQELRYQRLIAQLRCLVCQNESLADSDATLARDLRRQVFAQLQAGRSDAQIKQYLVERYSDFVLYDPPVTPRTWLLWFGPALLLTAGGWLVARTVRRRAHATTTHAGAPPATADEDW